MRSSTRRFKRTVRHIAEAYALAYGLHNTNVGNGGLGELEFHERALEQLGLDQRSKHQTTRYFRELRCCLRMIEIPNVDLRRAEYAHRLGATNLADVDVGRFFNAIVYRTWNKIEPQVRAQMDQQAFLNQRMKP